jgi:dienelactone hydrolase
MPISGSARSAAAIHRKLRALAAVATRDFVEVAKDLASRGWLAVAVIRRGFGQSDGPWPLPVTCQSTSFLPHFEADADDLAAAIDVIAARPDADPTRVIAIGVSAGGAAVMALAARNPKNLRGVINISGGLRMESCPKEDALVQALGEFGRKSRVPTLWMYARNDSFFGPDLAFRMRDAFLGGGGDVKFVMYDPIGQFRAAPAASNGCRKWTGSCVFTVSPLGSDATSTRCSGASAAPNANALSWKASSRRRLRRRSRVYSGTIPCMAAGAPRPSAMRARVRSTFAASRGRRIGVRS